VLATVSTDSAASAAGLQPGDELVSVAGVDRSTFTDFSHLVQQLAGSEVEVVYRRDGVVHTAMTRVGERLTAAGAAGIVGLIEGDRILAVEGLVRLLEVGDLPLAGAAPARIPVQDDGRTAEVGEAHDALGVARVREGEVGGELANLRSVVVDDSHVETDGSQQLRSVKLEGGCRLVALVATEGE